MFVVLLLLLCGVLLAPRCGSADPLERGAFGLLAAMTAAPVLSVVAAWLLNRPITAGSVGVCAVVVALAAAPGWRARAPRAPWAPQHSLLLAAAAVIGAVTAAHHSDAELLLAMVSWMERGEAECFYMQTFALVGEVASPAATGSVRDAWSVIAVPTNAAFTAPLLPLLDGATFRVIDVLTRALTGLFLALLLLRAHGSAALAGAVALLALLNPYVLGVEVLDRNVLAAMLSGAVLLALQTAPRAAWMHGVLLGLLAGAGLRFLPVVFVVPVLLHHTAPRPDRALRRDVAALVFGFIAAVAVSLPHLARHGLHSLGETQSLPALVWMTVTQSPRAPLAPYAAGPLHGLEALSRLGIVGVAAILAGAAVLLRRDRRRAAGLLVPIAAVALVLSVQRDWGQWDKLRIPLMLTVPCALLVGGWLQALMADRRGAVRAGVVGLAVAAGLAVGLPRLRPPPDASAASRHPVYATETEARLVPARRALRPGLLPGFQRLGPKLDWARKRLHERQLRSTVFPEGSSSLDTLRAVGWSLGGEPPAAPPPGAPVTVSVDLDLLLADPDAAVRHTPDAVPWVDTTAGGLLDVHHRTPRVRWQPDELNVTMLPLRGESLVLGEVVIELDAFVGDGMSPGGLRRVVPISGGAHPARAPALLAVPELSASPRVTVRLGRDQRLVVRQWVIGLDNGSPHRVDSWWITAGPDGPTVRFVLGEPESYL